MIRYVQNKVINYKRIQELLDLSSKAGVFTNNGPVKQLLEKHLEKTLFSTTPSTKRVACTNSGASALFVLISLFEKRAGKPLKWVSPAFTFPAASVNRLQTDILDIELETYTLPISSLGPYDGVIITTLFGTTPDLNKIEKYCKEHNKILILDNASSPLSIYNGRNINDYGDATIGSAHQTKTLGVGEGGFAVVPSNLYDEFNYLTNFGFNDERKYHNLGSNAKLSDIAAAFILSHMETYDLDTHIKIQNKYIEAINNMTGVVVFNKDEIAKSGIHRLVYGNMPVVFDKPISHLVFRDVGIESNRYYKPLIPAPNSDFLFNRIVNFPLYSTLTDYELSIILKKIEIESKNRKSTTNQ